mgnify:CR=1 FL=1
MIKEGNKSTVEKNFQDLKTINDNKHDDYIPIEESSNVEDCTPIHVEFDTSNKELDQMEFYSILEHKFKGGILIFKIKSA